MIHGVKAFEPAARYVPRVQCSICSTLTSMTQPKIHFLGDAAVLCNLPSPPTLLLQQRICSLPQQARAWPEVSDVVPDMNNVTLILRRPVVDLETVSRRILATWPKIDAARVA